MPYQMKTDEILEALQQSGHPAAPVFQETLEGLTNAMAVCLAQSHGIIAGVGTFQGTSFAGLCVPFYPASVRQGLPDAMEGYDHESEWRFDESFPAGYPLAFDPRTKESN